MKIHLIRSHEVQDDLYFEVVELVQAVTGPYEFIPEVGAVHLPQEKIEFRVIKDEEAFETKSQKNIFFDDHLNYAFPLERPSLSWGALFDLCASYRVQHNIPSEEMVLLLTNIANDSNWFSALDEENKFNGFIHTSDWEYYLTCRASFPVAYEVIALALQHAIFHNYVEIESFVHHQPIGCISDMCNDKKEVILKLRTADICPDCMQLLKPKVSLAKIQQTMQILEQLRTKMKFSQGFSQFLPYSAIAVDNHYRISLPGYENLVVKIGPLPKALYLFFLQHPEGIYLNHLHQHYDEIYAIYENIANRGVPEDWRQSIKDLVNTWGSNSCSEKLNNIRAEFKRLLGDELCKIYSINRMEDNKFRIEVLQYLKPSSTL